LKQEKWLFLLGLGALALFVVAVRLVVLFQTDFVADDALITYRYAENLIQGHGLVYNIGEKVLGTTTPLLTLLIAIFIKIGVTPTLFSPILNICCDAVSAILIVLAFRFLFNRTGFGFFAALLFGLFPATCVWATSGMEVSLYTMCLLGSLFLFLFKRIGWSFFFLGCALLTRIDALVLLVALVLTSLIAKERIGWKPWLVLILVLAPWLIAATLFYGSPIPNSLIAKKVFYSQLPEFQSTPIEIINGFIFGGKTSLVSSFYSVLFNIGFLILLGFALLGTLWILLKERRFWILPMWLGGYVAFFIVGKTHMHPWYFVPFYGVYITLIGLGVSWIWDGFFSLIRNVSFSRFLKTGIVTAAIVVGVVGIRYETKVIVHLLKEYQKTEDFLTGIALWLKENSDETDKIYYSDIGKLGYFSKRYILDSVGIISPVVTKYYKQKDWLGPIREVQPEFVMFAETDFRLPEFKKDAKLTKMYREIKQFDFKKSDKFTSTVYSTETSGIEFPIIIVYQKQS